jgi:hypothetical protein
LLEGGILPIFKRIVVFSRAAGALRIVTSPGTGFDLGRTCLTGI